MTTMIHWFTLILQQIKDSLNLILDSLSKRQVILYHDWKIHWFNCWLSEWVRSESWSRWNDSLNEKQVTLSHVWKIHWFTDLLSVRDKWILVRSGRFNGLNTQFQNVKEVNPHHDQNNYWRKHWFTEWESCSWLKRFTEPSGMDSRTHTLLNTTHKLQKYSKKSPR